MPDETDDAVSEAIEQSVTDGIKRSTGDGGSMEEHPLGDRIEADRYLRSRRASARALGIRRTKIIPGGPD